MFIERIKSYFVFILAYIGKLLPIYNDYLFFSSYAGQYADSPKYISEYMHDKYPNLKIIWEISEKCHEILPDYIQKVYPKSMKAIFMRSCSRIIVGNHVGWSSGYEKKGSLQLFFLRHLKKETQYDLCTWHGTPAKKIAIDEPGIETEGIDFYSSADLLCCGNTYLKSIFKHINYGKIPVVMSGLPRNDILFKDREVERKCLCQKLHLPEEYRILLYSPTFRDDIKWSGIHQMKGLDIERLLKVFSDKFGGEWVFVFRLHDSVLQKYEISQFLDGNHVFQGNIGDDMAEYMVVADALLTDYSSCFFDYALTKRPCFLYCPDYDQYVSEDRNFYIDMKQLPFPISLEADALYSDVKAFSKDFYDKAIDVFLHTIGNVETGSATKTLCQEIIRELGFNT